MPYDFVIDTREVKANATEDWKKLKRSKRFLTPSLVVPLHLSRIKVYTARYLLPLEVKDDSMNTCKMFEAVCEEF